MCCVYPDESLSRFHHLQQIDAHRLEWPLWHLTQVWTSTLRISAVRGDEPTKRVPTLQPQHRSQPAWEDACQLHSVLAGDFPQGASSPHSAPAHVQQLDTAPEESLGPHYYGYGQGTVPGLKGLVCSQALLLSVHTL